MYTIQILNEIETETAVYNVGQYDVTRDDLIEITGETPDDFEHEFCDGSGRLIKNLFNSLQCDLYIL
jgi:hypothetical protein